MLVPFGSFGELYGDIRGELRGEGEARGLKVPGETFSMLTFS